VCIKWASWGVDPAQSGKGGKVYSQPYKKLHCHHHHLAAFRSFHSFISSGRPRVRSISPFSPHFLLRFGHALPTRRLKLAIFASFPDYFWSRGVLIRWGQSSGAVSTERKGTSIWRGLCAGENTGNARSLDFRMGQFGQFFHLCCLWRVRTPGQLPRI
jgi:hypothetical protein